jgi:hypothetical protein
MTRFLFLSLSLLLSANLLAAGNGVMDLPADFERILVPLLTPPVQGAFGSEFRTALSVHSSSEGAQIEIKGLSPICILSACPTVDSIVLDPGQDVTDIELSGTPGRFIFVRAEDRKQLGINLRAYDVSREASNFGTEIPLASADDFSSDSIRLAGVPMTPAFRKTLRVYSAYETEVVVSFEGREIIGSPVIGPPPSVVLRLRRQGTSMFETAYAVLSQFPHYPYPLTIVVRPIPPCAICPQPHFAEPIWAFLSVTNNNTQHITTITPQP